MTIEVVVLEGGWVSVHSLFEGYDGVCVRHWLTRSVLSPEGAMVYLMVFLDGTRGRVPVFNPLETCEDSRVDQDRTAPFCLESSTYVHTTVPANPPSPVTQLTPRNRCWTGVRCVETRHWTPLSLETQRRWLWPSACRQSVRGRDERQGMVFGRLSS